MSSNISDKVYGLTDSEASQKRIAVLKAQDARVLKFPSVNFKRVLDQSAVNKAAQNLANYDLIIFSDIHTVGVFLEVLEENAVDLFELDNLTVCAFGEAVSDRLRFVQIHSDVIPAKLDEESIFGTIRDFISDPDELKGLRVLFLKSAGEDARVSERLRSKVASLDELGVYQWKGISARERIRLTTLIKSGAMDEIIFCCVEDVQNLASLFYPEILSEILAGTQISSTDATAFQTLREHDLNPRLIP